MPVNRGEQNEPDDAREAVACVDGMKKSSEPARPYQWDAPPSRMIFSFASVGLNYSEENNLCCFHFPTRSSILEINDTRFRRPITLHSQSLQLSRRTFDRIKHASNRHVAFHIVASVPHLSPRISPVSPDTTLDGIPPSGFCPAL